MHQFIQIQREFPNNVEMEFRHVIALGRIEIEVIKFRML